MEHPMTDAVERVARALLPCPFCGGTGALGELTEEVNRGGWIVECIACQASTRVHFSVKEDARPHVTDAWNKRAAQPGAAAAGDSPGNRFSVFTHAERLWLRDAIAGAIKSTVSVGAPLYREVDLTLPTNPSAAPAVPPPEASGWQPIETLPEFKRAYVGRYEDHGDWEGPRYIWRQIETHWYNWAPAGKEPYRNWAWGDTDPIYGEPTHWHPLIQPPSPALSAPRGKA
jgi:Lar family restriction alleviation protein